MAGKQLQGCGLTTILTLLLLFLPGGAEAVASATYSQREETEVSESRELEKQETHGRPDKPGRQEKRGTTRKPALSSIHELNKVEGSLNSHADDWDRSSLEMDRRSLTVLRPGQPLVCSNPNYPRLKKLADGSFLLIYQQNPIAHEVYCATSPDLVSWWTAAEPLFKKQDWKQFDGATRDRILFSSADAIVLADGDVLAFASFRLNKGYRLDNRNNGLMMRRSTDNGRTWGAFERIHTGTTWEPSAIQLPSGEIQVYFTDADPNKGDSGTSILRSKDKGRTWEYVRKPVRQRSGVASDGTGVSIFTDQMPVAVRLNGSDSVAVAFESRFGRGTAAKYNLGLAYTDDNWASAVPDGGQRGPGSDPDGSGLEAGNPDISAADSPRDSPRDRRSNLFLDCAAPYLRQFRSGETVLSYNTAMKFSARLGDSNARDFGPETRLFDVSSCWGSVELIDDHTLVGVYPSTTSKDGVASSDILLAKFVLNHRVSAPELTPRVDGRSQDWTAVSDALFIGSESQAQVAFRFACDNANLYCLVECKDDNLTASDSLRLMLHGGGAAGDPLVLDFSMSGRRGLTCSDKDIKLAWTLFGKTNEHAGSGYAAEVAIPLGKLGLEGDRLLFNAVLSGEYGTDTFSGLTSANSDRWIPVELETSTQ